ncbi:dolichol-phosphate mannosyltransferase subunit 3 [Coniophora puteana RWD-64-598 SS2]|uniref:Dolichol-phosphate mannosyltransferase subunit 3 n=1 Tax=Coniophora puteana (strain RWD-64-598) TaxID=741705 RepID=A0A5M3M9M9_CONPW|nr:dolichol-phosphate mannosyltransferase subunit 3 [Coniophora puteana RWD-64-598 SS2]EIW75564.1 dolichol-phosphate mannosyltransferase subunit 3 [Coniophora puteana RWD-64-598 SS2]
MARAHRILLFIAIFAVTYIAALFSYLPIPLVDSETLQEILPAVPWWALVSFGAYSLWSMGWGLWTFRDCPEAYTELIQQISEAKNDLRAKGVTVD